MKPLLVLLSAFAIALFILKVTKGDFHFALAGRIAMSAMLLFTAIAHFAFTKGMASMLPDFIPAKTEVVLFTGLLEIFLAIGLLLPNYRVTIAWILILFLILILPANIKAAIDNINYQTGEGNGEGVNYLWFRIPLQIFFILWTYLSSIKN